MATVATLQDEIRAYIPFADPITIQTLLRHTVYDFMKQTMVFTDREEIDTQCGVSEYLLILPEGRDLVYINGVLVGGEWISDWHRDGHEPVVVLDSDYHSSCCFAVDYAWATRALDCELPEALVNKYFDALLTGTLARLHRVSGTPLDDLRKALDAERRYREQVEDATINRCYNFSNSRPTIHRPQRRSGLKGFET